MLEGGAGKGTGMVAEHSVKLQEVEGDHHVKGCVRKWEGKHNESPHGLCPESGLQVFHNLVPHLCLFLIKDIQTLHLR